MSKENIVFYGEEWVDFSKKYKLILREVIKKADEHISFFEQFKEKEVLEYIEKYTDSPLFKYLYSLSDEEVKGIKTIMYIGRDKDHNPHGTPNAIFEQKYNELELANSNKKVIDIEVIVQKSPLKTYIIDGMGILKLT